MGTLLQDVKYGLRMLAKNRAFTAIAILTLALGIGVNSAVFSVVNGVLLNPLPFPEPDRLVTIYENSATFEASSISYPNFLDWQRRNTVFSKIAVFRSDSMNLTGNGEAEQANTIMVSSDFFPLLGVNPIRGRLFTADEDRLGAGRTVLLNEGFWKRKFGADPQIVGKSVVLSGNPYTVIGIIPASFRLSSGNYSDRADLYMPVGLYSDPMFQRRDVHEGMDAVARLKPGVTIEQARAEMSGIAKQLEKEYPDADKGAGITIRAMKDDEVRSVRAFLLVLLGAVGFVLLIACVNVANLQLARALGRAREFAVRTAMGASPLRVVRQLLTESILLGLTGGAIGLLLAWAGTKAALKVLPDALPRSESVGLDGRVLAFTLIASIVAGVVFGLVPALRTMRPDVQETLRESGRGQSGTKQRAQGIFVVIETALALILLVGAGLMIRSLVDLWHVDPGFNAENVLAFSVALQPSAGVNGATTKAAFRELQDKLEHLPGIQAVSLTGGSLPMQGDSEIPFWLEGEAKPTAAGDMKLALFYFADSGYLETMGLRLKRGRFLAASDDEHAPCVITVDESFAHKFYEGSDPIGKHITLDIVNVQCEIVGIVNHVKHWGLASDSTQTIQAQVYLPLMQLPDAVFSGPPTVRVVARTNRAPEAMTQTIRQAISQISSENVMYDTKSMTGIISDSLSSERFTMILLAVFAGLALLLSCIGIFGVISYVVTQRTHEIGIRIALGAQRNDVMKLMLGEGMKMTLLGVAIGLAASFFLTRLMAKLLFGVSATDPVTFIGVAIILSGVALVACYLPTRRAMRVDPMVALRYE